LNLAFEITNDLVQDEIVPAGEFPEGHATGQPRSGFPIQLEFDPHIVVGEPTDELIQLGLIIVFADLLTKLQFLGGARGQPLLSLLGLLRLLLLEEKFVIVHQSIHGWRSLGSIHEYKIKTAFVDDLLYGVAVDQFIRIGSRVNQANPRGEGSDIPHKGGFVRIRQRISPQ